MSALKVIKFETQGPLGTGLALQQALPNEGVAEGSPVQHAHTYFNDTTATLTAGVWTSTAYTEPPGVCGAAEFMIVLEGSVGIVDASGDEEIFATGDAFVMPKGMSNYWRQSEFMRKFYVIFNDPSGEEHDDISTLKAKRVDCKSAITRRG